MVLFIVIGNLDGRSSEMVLLIQSIEFKVDVGYQTDFKQALVNMSRRSQRKTAEVFTGNPRCSQRPCCIRKVLTTGKS